MAVIKLVNAAGTELLLPGCMVKSVDDPSGIPAQAVEGRDGEAIDEDRVVNQPRKVSVVGSLDGVTPAGLDTLYRQVSAFVNSKSPLRLYRHDDKIVYLPVRKETFVTSYQSGLSRVIADVSISFRASDPFWTGVLQQIAMTSTPLTVVQPGTLARQHPIVFITPTSGSLVNPQVSLATTGEILLYTGTVAAAYALVANFDRRLAYYTDGDLAYYLNLWGLASPAGTAPTSEVNALASLNAAWFTGGLPFVPGNNSVIYTGAGSYSVTFAWLPRYY